MERRDRTLFLRPTMFFLVAKVIIYSHISKYGNEDKRDTLSCRQSAIFEFLLDIRLRLSKFVKIYKLIDKCLSILSSLYSFF
jgi:hypothetical protein